MADIQENIDIKIDAKDVKNLQAAFQNVDNSVKLVIDHFTQLENKIVNIGQVVNNNNKNINKKIKNTINHSNNFNNDNYTIGGQGGTFYSSKSSRSKGYKSAEKEYLAYQHQAVNLQKELVRTQAEITKLKAEEAKYYRTKVLSDRRNSVARKIKAEYFNSDEHKNYEKALTEQKRSLKGFYDFKSAHPELFVNGANLRNPRYQFGRALTSIGGTLGGIGVGADKLEGRFLGGSLSIVGGILKNPIAGSIGSLALLAKGIKSLGEASITAFKEIEATKTQLEVVFANPMQANAMFNDIAQYAVKSPFGVQQTSELAVLLKQSGVYASDLMSTLKMLGDTAGGNMEKMKRIANNYAQIVSIGKASMLDMRQFAYAGIPIFEAVSKELGVSQQELRKLISDGKVTSQIIEKVFKDLTGINGIFENATDKGAKTLKARLQNLQDAKQLAMSDIGQYVFDIGSKTGDDSLLNKGVSNLEKLYSWIHEKVNTVNIEKSVKEISSRKTQREELYDLIRYNDVRGNKQVVAVLKEELAKLDDKDKESIDKDRATYELMWQNLSNKHSGTIKKYNLSNLEDTDDEIRKLRATKIEKQRELRQFNDRYPNHIFTMALQYLDPQSARQDDFFKERKQLKKEVSLIHQEINDLEELRSDYTLKIGTNGDIRKSHRETVVLSEQTRGSDTVSKFSDKTSSLNSSFQELYEMYYNSEEQKAKREEEHIQTLKEAQEELRKLNGKINDKGVIDLTKFSGAEFTEFNKKGAFTSGRKLTVVKGKNEEELKRDSELLNEQFTWALNEIRADFLMQGDKSFENKLNSYRAKQEKRFGPKTDEHFYQYSPKLYTDLLNGLKGSRNKSNDEGEKARYQDFIDLLANSLFEHELQNGGLLAQIELPKDIKKKSFDFVPLWKRELSKTGISTQLMTNPVTVMKDYLTEIAPRQLSGNVLKSSINSLGYETSKDLVKYSGQKLQLPGTDFYVQQIDWNKTTASIKKFALQLSAATDVVSAYKTSIQSEINMIEEILVGGWTETESQDLKKQKYISSATLAKLSFDENSQFVNAFGKTYKTATGSSVTMNEQGQFVDETGNVVTEQQLVVTEDIYKLIERELPKLKEELHEAKKAEIRNREFGKIVGANQKNGLYLRDIFTQQGLTRNALYLVNNIDSYEEELKSLWDNKYKGTLSKDNQILKDLSYEDLKMYSLSYNPFIHNDKSIEVAARNMVQYIMSDFLAEWKKNKTALYAETANIKSAGGVKDFAIASDLLNLDYKTVEEMLKPENKEGFRGIKAKFLKTLGLESSYDMEDVYDLVNRLGWEEKGISAGFESGDKKEADKLENLIDKQFAVENLKETLSSVGEELLKINNDFSKGLWEKPFEKWTENLVKGKDLMEDMDDVMKGLAADTLEAAGASMQKAGWELVANGAATKNIGMVAAGFGLAAAGGASKGLANALNSKDTEKDEADKSLEKLNKLKDDLRDLLKQAREDSIYYENTTRHKKAITIGSSLSGTKVNDAIIAPNGNVITTHPDDYLIATKTPQRLGNSMAAPIVNIKNIDNSNGVNIKSKVNYNPATNTVDIEAVIENKVADFIASERSDMAFQVREQRRSGQQYVG